MKAADRYVYTHGGNVYDQYGRAEDVIDFSASINPLGMPEGTVAAIGRAAERAAVYPDSACRRLVSALAEVEEVEQAHILCSNGASDLLFRLVYAVKPTRILVAAPSFADYERAGRAVGANVIYYTLRKENLFAIDKSITRLIRTASPDVVFLCNPNNPTGGVTDMETMEGIAEACGSVGALLLVDECFLDFVDEPRRYSMKPLLSQYSHIVILKAFTKTFAMPGLRLGYVLCGDEALLDRMRFCGPDWAVSNVAQEAGIAALQNGRNHIEKTRAFLAKERERIAAALDGLGLTVYPAWSNFLFFHCPFPVDLYVELRKQGLVLRNCANFAGLEAGYFRTAVLTREKNDLLIRAINGVLAP